MGFYAVWNTHHHNSRIISIASQPPSEALRSTLRNSALQAGRPRKRLFLIAAKNTPCRHARWEVLQVRHAPPTFATRLRVAAKRSVFPSAAPFRLLRLSLLIRPPSKTTRCPDPTVRPLSLHARPWSSLTFQTRRHLNQAAPLAMKSPHGYGFAMNRTRTV